MNMILIGFGANLDSKDGASPVQSVQRAAKELEERGVSILAGSSIWKSAPVPISDQPWYHNAVCRVKTILSPSELLQLVAFIENEAGRVRNGRNEARVIDLDILAYNQQVIKTANLQVPHPRMHERAFVLYPLQEIAADWVHPASGKAIEEMIKSLDAAQQIECTDIKLI
jgi:2-amino-4-hydroxy-6-hydroxymethyldihydropteridine diphosphokinase